MPLALLLSTALLFQASGSLGFAEALSRAQRYEDDAKASAWRKASLDPLLKAQVLNIFDRCYPATAPRTEFTMVISFSKGRFDRIERNDEGRIAECVADAFATLPYAKPPYDDFAEEIRVELDPANR